MVNPQEAGGQTKPHKFWQAAISQDVAQKLIDSMPGRIANVVSETGPRWAYISFYLECRQQKQETTKTNVKLTRAIQATNKEIHPQIQKGKKAA